MRMSRLRETNLFLKGQPLPQCVLIVVQLGERPWETNGPYSKVVLNKAQRRWKHIQCISLSWWLSLFSNLNLKVMDLKSHGYILHLKQNRLSYKSPECVRCRVIPFHGTWRNRELHGTTAFAIFYVCWEGKCFCTLNCNSCIVFGGVTGHLRSLQSLLKDFGLLFWWPSALLVRFWHFN